MLSRVFSQVSFERIGKLPQGVPDESEKTRRQRDLTFSREPSPKTSQRLVRNYTLAANVPLQIVLQEHEHIEIENTGANTVQYSNSNNAFTDWLPSTAVKVQDEEFQRVFWLNSVAGSSIRIETW